MEPSERPPRLRVSSPTSTPSSSSSSAEPSHFCALCNKCSSIFLHIGTAVLCQVTPNWNFSAFVESSNMHSPNVHSAWRTSRFIDSKTNLFYYLLQKLCWCCWSYHSYCFINSLVVLKLLPATPNVSTGLVQVRWLDSPDLEPEREQHRWIHPAGLEALHTGRRPGRTQQQRRHLTRLECECVCVCVCV